MAVNLAKMSRVELEQLDKDVQKQLQTLEAQHKKDALAAAKKAAAALGFSLADLVQDGAKPSA